MPPASLICLAARLAAATIVLPAETNDPDSAATTPIFNSSSARTANGVSSANVATAPRQNFVWGLQTKGKRIFFMEDFSSHIGGWMGGMVLGGLPGPDFEGRRAGLDHVLSPIKLLSSVVSLRINRLTTALRKA